MRTHVARLSVLLFVLLCSCALMAQTQEVNGVRVSELAVPNYGGENVLGVYKNATETFIVLKQDGGRARILYKNGNADFVDVDLRTVIGTFWVQSFLDGQTTTRQPMILSSDALYFATGSTSNSLCGSSYPTGGSYRIKNGKVETLVVGGQVIDVKTPDGKTQKATIYCATAGTSLGATDGLFWIKVANLPSNNTSIIGDLIVKKEGSLFTVLVQLPYAVPSSPYPYPYALGLFDAGFGVSGKENDLSFIRRFTGSPTLVNSNGVKAVDTYVTDTYKGQPVTSWSYTNDPDTGERFLRLTTKDGLQYLTAVSATGLTELFTISTIYPEFTGAVKSISIDNTMSRQMSLVSIAPTGVTRDAVGVWTGSGSVKVLLKKGDAINGKTIQSLHNPDIKIGAEYAVSGCTGLVPVYQTGTAKLQMLLEVSTCVPPTPQPLVTAITDLYGKIGASPVKAMTIWGNNFCKLASLVPLVNDSAIPLKNDSTLGCKAEIDGKAVGLYFAFTNLGGGSQMNVQLPYDLPKGSHTVVVKTLENVTKNVLATSTPFTFVSEDVSPTFFKPPDYPLTIQNVLRGSTLVSATNPASAGDYFVIYLSGGGQTILRPPDGASLVSAFTAPVKVTIGGVETPVLYAGSQGSFPGIEQINIQVPSGAKVQDGTTTMTVQIGDKSQDFIFHLN